MSKDDNWIKFTIWFTKTTTIICGFMGTMSKKWQDAIFHGNVNLHQMTELSQEINPDETTNHF
ncbi:hypothetical protein HHX48_04050 [Salinimonas sp. HHU 13199]|uniref:Uncharacterized protein n=1 Tax=Salinimonas profundi TaxID=2729140 RepID=A0ABR8LF70_9ALTE|nr:hypothetical protein [Salinimonas profundi]MBD3584909.1 hypothetical protein [Salinimonas profundi]